MILDGLRIDNARVVAELEQLARHNATTSPAVTRVVFSEQDRSARDYLTELFHQAGLKVRCDAVGNIFARWEGSEPELPVVGTGSHCDAIPFSGRFDGTVGVLGGLEAIRALKNADFQPRRSIELLMFTSEEPTRYGIGCLGSRLLSGQLDPSVARDFKDSDQVTLEKMRTHFGCMGSLQDVCLPAKYYDSFVELHIEQGPLLEQQGLPIGVVTAIAAPAALRGRIRGEGGHAGAVLMLGRKDALLAAAELALAVERNVLKYGGEDTVGTTGYLKVHPCAVNSIPSLVEVEMDIRDIDATRRDEVLNRIKADATEIAARRSLSIELDMINADPPAISGARVIDAIHQACADSGLPHRDMISRAYHDSLFMAMITQNAMIFIPCYKGYSHRPDEFASPEAIGRGVEVLARTLAKLSVSR